jgi:hypothetical protein
MIGHDNCDIKEYRAALQSRVAVIIDRVGLQNPTTLKTELAQAFKVLITEAPHFCLGCLAKAWHCEIKHQKTRCRKWHKKYDNT